jgi:signal transduction histidine kinase
MVIARQQQDLQQQQISSLEKQQQVIALQSMINGQEGERTRIARDLHDGLGGIFSTVKMHFSTLQHEVPELKSNNLYRKSFEMVDGASEELRKIAHNMMPEVLMKMGLVPALQDLCNNIGAGKQLHINLQAYGMDKRLSASIEVMLFRIIQELINNIIKHSGASETIIQFNRNANNLNITVEDNGNGFDVNEIETKRQAGLQTIRSRVAFLDGRISIDSKTGVGTTVMIDLLLNEQ